MGGYAWVTLATNDAYSLGALVLAHSLRRVGTTHDLVCMVTPGVTSAMREKLAAVFSMVQEVNVLDSKDEANLALLARPELGITFTKLHCWRLTQYEKCVFIDADALVVRNCDELFEREELSAAPDVGWPDCFNSGVFVFRPSQQTFASITAFAAAKGSFDGGDQGLLNMYFSDWATKDISKHLPFIYNMCSTATYSYLPAFKQFGEDVRIIHFIGITKPWLQYFDTLTGTVQPPEGSGHLQPLLQLWWNIFCEQVHSQLSASMVRSTVSIWNMSSSHLPPVPTRAARYKPNDGTYNDTNRQAPDFSEFRDPWEGYRPQDDSFSINGRGASNNNYEEGHYATDRFLAQVSGQAYGKEYDTAHQTERNVPHLGRDQQSRHEQRYDERHISLAPLQTYDQQQCATPYVANERNQHAIPHSEENYSQRHTEHRHQHHEQRHYEHQEHGIEHHHEQRHNHEQHQQNERRYHDEQHQQRRSSEQDRQSERSQQDDHDPHETYLPICVQYYNGQWHWTEVKEGNDASDSNQASCQNEKYDSTFYDNKFYVRHTMQSHPSSNKHAESSSEIAQTDTPKSDFIHIPSLSIVLKPYTDSHNVDTLLYSRSDAKIMEHPNKTDAGIAGALAQMTLGEARSAEQTALEDQMRKQSWEQGQIDYMGRDSFDNIWKKIMETLSQAPQQTPPKEDIPKAEERATTDDDKPAEQIAVSADVVPAAEPDKDPTQGQLLACKTPEEKSSAQIIVARESGDGAVIVAQPSEQPKTTTSPSEKIPAVEAVATKLSSESPQPPSATQGDFCMKPSQYVAPCEASTDVPAPQPLPMELSSVAQMSAEQQCKLVTPITQETPSQDKSESAKLEEQAAFVSLPTEQAACILQKPIAPITQTDDGAPIECKAPLQLPAADKPQIPAPVAPDVTQPAVPIAIPGAPTPVEPVQDSAKLATESKVDVTQPLAIDPGERCAEMLLAASEVSTVSPVPIQVAESVLQTEPKEAVSGAAVAARDQAIATTITAVHEPAAVAPVESETRPVQMNGSACDAEKAVGDIAAVTPAVPSSPEKPVAAIELTKEPAGDSTTTKDAPLEIPPVPSVLPITEEKIVSSSSAAPPETSSEKLAKPAEQIAETGKGEPIAQIAKTESTETKPPEQTAKTEAAEALKPTEQIAKAETIEGKPAEQVASAEITKTIAKPGTIEVPAKAEAAVIPTESTEQAPKTEAAAKSPGEVPKPPVAEQKPPSESIEAKALDIPSTPTVIEATPPTSPSVESAQEVQEGQDKTAKKSLKKSDSADGTDGEGATDKKTGKKNAKKVTKKPKSSKPEETAAPATETVAVTTAATAPTTATATVAGAGADSSQGKTKKTVKVTKKTGTKTGQSLETDTAIPETPPPPTPTSATATTVTAAPDVPVPPKRKTKTTTSGKGTTGKKSETEE